MKQLHTDICIIGAGAGGLSVAAASVQMGAKVVLIESGKMGGDCLNYGCVPSKSLLACAKVARAFTQSTPFGVTAVTPEIDMQAVMSYVQSVIDKIAPHDSVERFEQLGVTVIQAKGEFVDKHTVKAGETLIKAKYIVIATGSRAVIPSVLRPSMEHQAEGVARRRAPDRAQFTSTAGNRSDRTPEALISHIPYFTNETIFSLTEAPKHLVIIGGGPIGCEMAQAFLSLGAKVTLLEAAHILPRDEPHQVEALRQILIEQGLQLYEQATISKTDMHGNEIDITFQHQQETKKMRVSHVLVSAGRRPNIEGLNLDAASIQHDSNSITIDQRLRTSNKRVFAIGDVTGGYQFTHIANYHAGIVIRQMLFKLPVKASDSVVPWVTYTDPELARVGLSKVEALKSYPDAKILSWDFENNDRAKAENLTRGNIQLITTKKGKILGVSILGAHAGELLLPWILLIQQNRTVRDMVGCIVPYPTFSEINKHVAGEFYKPVIFSERMKRWVRKLMRIPFL